MTDFIINLCLKDRFMVLLAAIVLALAGVWSFKNMPIDAIPDLSDVQVIINTDTFLDKDCIFTTLIYH